MSSRANHPGRVALLVLAVAAAILLWTALGDSQPAAGSSASADSNGKLFTGGGRGPTAEVAIRSAQDDAATSASAEGLYTCTPVGEPEVFESTNDPNFGHIFRAQATVSCTP
jgi:hypothetical protein